ncbi:MAG: NUDIX hydrolase [Bacteroidota bacterium]
MNSLTGKRFNIRVYGLIINSLNEVLLSDECRADFSFTKFPGGGLEFGESLTSCLQRELHEELGLEFEIGELFYVNEHVQLSKFNENDQLFTFYFLVNGASFEGRFRDKYEIPLTIPGEKQRWKKITSIQEEDFTFPIDKIVAKKLLTLYA